MPIDEQQILPSVVVVIEKSIAKPHKRHSGHRHSDPVADVGEIPFSVIIEDQVIIVGKIRDRQIKVTVVLIVAGGNSHIRDLAAVPVHREAAQIALIVECAVAFVDVQKVRRRIVGHHQVRLAVPIDIHEEHAETVITVGVADPGLFAHVGERAVAVVMKQMVVLSLKSARTAHHVRPAILAQRAFDGIGACNGRVMEVVADVAGHKKVQPAIPVVVSEGGAGVIDNHVGGAAVERDAGLFRYIRECPVVVIVVQAVLPQIGDVEIGPAIVVIVAHRAAKPPPVIRDSRFFRHLGKRSIAVVVEERRVRRNRLPAQCVDGRSIHQVDVEPAVVVVVEKADARTLGLDNDLLRGSAGRIVPPCQAGLFGCIHENNRACLDETASGDGTMLAVELGLLSAAASHSPLLLRAFLGRHARVGRGYLCDQGRKARHAEDQHGADKARCVSRRAARRTKLPPITPHTQSVCPESHDSPLSLRSVLDGRRCFLRPGPRDHNRRHPSRNRLNRTFAILRVYLP